MGLKEVVFPVDNDRPYGVASACFLLLVTFAEIEGLAWTALGLLAGRTDLFLQLQFAIAPAAFLVAFSGAAANYVRHRALQNRVRYTTDLSENPEVKRFADRLATRRKT